MNTGVVLQFSAAKGFGFISDANGGPDVFCHWTAIDMDGYKRLSPGQTVQYDVEVGPKGKPQACNVRVVRQEVEVGGASS